MKRHLHLLLFVTDLSLKPCPLHPFNFIREYICVFRVNVWIIQSWRSSVTIFLRVEELGNSAASIRFLPIFSLSFKGVDFFFICTRDWNPPRPIPLMYFLVDWRWIKSFLEEFVVVPWKNKWITIHVWRWHRKDYLEQFGNVCHNSISHCLGFLAAPWGIKFNSNTFSW